MILLCIIDLSIYYQSIYLLQGSEGGVGVALSVSVPSTSIADPCITKTGKNQGEMGHWTVSYNSPQSVKITIFYSFSCSGFLLIFYLLGH